MALSTVLALADSAAAGVYPIYTCSGPSGWVNRAWAARVNNSAPGYNVTGTYQVCSASDPTPFMRAKLQSVSANPPDSGPASWDAASAEWALQPLPAGTEPQTLTAAVRCDDAGATESWIVFGGTQQRCTTSDFTGVEIEASSGTPVVRALVRCADLAACAAAPALGWIDIREITAWVTDLTAPSGSTTGGTLLSGGARSGTQTLTYSGSDNTGLSSAALLVDDEEVASTDFACDYTKVKPCADVASATFSVDTGTLSNGAHDVQLELTDASGNTSLSTPQTATTSNADTSAPEADAGGGWYGLEDKFADGSSTQRIDLGARDAISGVRTVALEQVGGADVVSVTDPCTPGCPADVDLTRTFSTSGITEGRHAYPCERDRRGGKRRAHRVLERQRRPHRA